MFLIQQEKYELYFYCIYKLFNLDGEMKKRRALQGRS